LKNPKLGSAVNVRTFTQSVHFIICVFFHAGKELLKLFGEQILYFPRTIIKSAMLLTQI